MQQIRIDFDNPGLPQSLGVVEGESQSRIFQAALYKSGAAYTAPAGAVYSIMYRGFGPQNQGWYDTIEDGAGKRAACTVSGNVVTCELARQALRVPGHLTVVLCVSDAKGYMLKSWPIMADVRNDGYEDTGEIEMYFNLAGIAGNYLTQLEKAMTDAEATKNNLISASTQVQKDIDAKAAAALESIPEEYTELDGSVKQLKEDLAQIENTVVGKNLLNPNTVTVGKRMYTNGTVYTQDSDFYTDFISVKPNQHIYASFLNSTGDFIKSQIRHVCAYDASKTALPSKGQPNPGCDYLVPDGVAYIIVTFTQNTHIDHRQLEVSDNGITSFEEWFAPYTELKAQAQIDKNTSDITDLGNIVDSISINVDKLNKADSVTVVSKTPQGIARRENRRRLKLWEMPIEFDFNVPFNVYTDGTSFVTDFNAEDYKNDFSNVKYFAPDGDDSADGTFERPWKSFSKITADTTCYLKNGIYTLENFANWNGRLYVNFDLIGLGDVKIVNGDCPSNWVLDGGVYKTALTHNYYGVADIYTDKAGVVYSLASSLAECKASKCSYYIDDTYVYINTPLSNPNSKLALFFNDADKSFLIYAHNTDTTPFLQNIKWYGSPNSENKDTPSVEFVSYTTEIGNSKAVFDKCGFYCGFIGVRCNQEAEVIFNECECANVWTDGFQYFGKAKSIELNCKGFSCGNDNVRVGGQYENGSTAHGTCKTLRINCQYYDNNGGNCADAIMENSFSICLGCSAFDSSATDTNQGFALQGNYLARMYLEGCVAFGNVTDIAGGANATITVKNCEYDTIGGNGGIINVIN